MQNCVTLGHWELSVGFFIPLRWHYQWGVGFIYLLLYYFLKILAIEDALSSFHLFSVQSKNQPFLQDTLVHFTEEWYWIAS